MTDRVTMPDGQVVTRDVVEKRGAVGVVALHDDGRVVLVRQYRHPVRQYLWELPAGLIDVDGEELPDVARRELMEEADLHAGRVEHLIDLYLSPGFTNERIRIFLATGLTEVPDGDRHTREAEEADMQVRSVPMAEALEMIMKGEITNAASVAGLLAAEILARAKQCADRG
ncbi:MAG TPA: NUDIX hydrolase [Candidatus Limnocylindrales bacterium]